MYICLPEFRRRAYGNIKKAKYHPPPLVLYNLANCGTFLPGREYNEPSTSASNLFNRRSSVNIWSSLKMATNSLSLPLSRGSLFLIPHTLSKSGPGMYCFEQENIAEVTLCEGELATRLGRSPSGEAHIEGNWVLVTPGWQPVPVTRHISESS